MRLSLLEWDEPETPVRTRSAPKPRKPKPAKAKAGKTKFHGAFSDSKDAEAKHKTIPGSFIKPVKIRGKSRYAVIEKVS